MGLVAVGVGLVVERRRVEALVVVGANEAKVAVAVFASNGIGMQEGMAEWASEEGFVEENEIEFAEEFAEIALCVLQYCCSWPDSAASSSGLSSGCRDSDSDSVHSASKGVEVRQKLAVYKVARAKVAVPGRVGLLVSPNDS
jgi:hypothetical protein